MGMSASIRRWGEMPEGNPRTTAIAATIAAAAVAVTGVAAAVNGPVLPIAIIASLAVLGTLILVPRVGILLFLILAWANVPVLLGRHLGNPWAVGAAAVQIFLLRRGWIIDRPFLLMLAFLGTVLLSSLVARDPGIAFAWVGTYAVEGLLLYVLLVNAIRNRAALRAAVWALIGVSVVLTGLGVYQEIAQDYTNDFGGLAQRKLSRWDESKVGESGLIRERQKVSAADRIGGPVNDPNHFGQLLVVILPMAFLLTRSEKTRTGRWIAAACTVVLLGGVMLTYSRGTFLVMLGLILLAVPLGYLRWRQLLLGAVAVIAATAIVAPGYFARMDTIRGLSRVQSDAAEWQSGDHAVRGRLTEMLAAAHVVLDYPIIGVGPGQYTPFYSLHYMSLPGVAFKEIDVERRAHTLYAELAAETGLLGLGLFLILVGTVLLRVWRLRQRTMSTRPDVAHLATGIGLAIVAYLGTGVFLSLAFQRYFWLLVALAGAACQVLDRPSDRMPRGISS
jgi:hypothetical protein